MRNQKKRSWAAGRSHLKNCQLHDRGEFGISFFDPDCCPTRAPLDSSEQQGTLFFNPSFSHSFQVARFHRYSPVMSVSVDLPRRGRRSSISEHIHRVFHVDRPDKVRSPALSGDIAIDPLKKRQSIHSDGGSPGQSSAWTQPKTGAYDPKFDAATNYATPARSSFTYSSQASGQPAPSTPHSSPPFRSVVPEDENGSPQQMPTMEPNKTEAERDKICSSPTWHKDIARKERRATKRLEADRKDLEERLLRLEANQARLEQGIYDRAPRRLTKKQPLGSSNRSSSANSEISRSSSAFSSFFSSSRRSSRSRASSVSGNDGTSRRGSTDTAPTLSLTLPERFGTAISRELAAKHGTFLLPSHQPQRTIHTAPKSDDLRENWRVAEAWQRKYGENESDAEMSSRKSELVALPQPVAHSMAREDGPRSRFQTRESTAELDRELFTANLRHDGRPLGSRPMVNSSVSQGSTSFEPNPPSSSNQSHIPRSQQVTDAKLTRVTTARQLQDLSQPENMPTLPNRGLPRSLLPGAGKATLSQQNHTDPPSQHPKNYKSSPLALQPSTMENFGSLKEVRPSTTAKRSGLKTTPQLPQSRGAGPGHLKEVAGNEQRDSIGSPLPSTAQNGQYPENRRLQSSTNKQGQLPEQMRGPPHEIHRLKHAARSVSRTIDRPDQIVDEVQQLPNTGMDTPIDSRQEPIDKSALPLEEAHRGRPSVQCLNSSARSRSPSQISSHASYDTADEEVLNVPLRDNAQATSPEVSVTASPRPTQDTLIVNKQRTDHGSTKYSLPPPLARDGSLTRLRRKVKKQAKPLMPDQLVAKVFVVCCRCNYWHDMPSEVYARLACPERLPSDSLLARTFSRRNSSSRKGSLRSSLLASDPSGKGRLSMPGRAQPNQENTQAARESKAAAGTPLTPPSCCWCKHSMSRSCCQGWTTLVQMRERHH